MNTRLNVGLLRTTLLALFLVSSGVSLGTIEQEEPLPEEVQAAFGHDEAVIASVQKFRESWFHRIENETALTRRQIKWVSRLGRPKQETSFFDDSPSPSLRKEYRQLTEEERQKFHAAVIAMNEDLIDGKSKYHSLVEHHFNNRAPSAHWGSAFLPWHREYLTRFEKALQEYDPSVSLPYWDSQLDALLPEPQDSIIWSDDFLGNHWGYVTSGPFAQWSTPGACVSKLYRFVPQRQRSALMDEDKINILKDFTSFQGLVANGRFEYYHGGPHGFVGGQMRDISCSPSDPIFWMHHAFIDLLWEDFRQNIQETDLETEYPWNLFGSGHNPDAIMRPFETVRNIDGLRLKYTRGDYIYAPRPITCSVDNQCGPSLWCHAERCQSKVRTNGDCSGFPINSTVPCERGRCVPLIDTYRCMEV